MPLPSAVRKPTDRRPEVPNWEAVFTMIPELSQREREVFRALGEGASNRTIAGRLHITERTVKAHVAQVLAKLRVESRLQAGIAAYAWAMSTEQYKSGPPLPFRLLPDTGTRAADGVRPAAGVTAPAPLSR
ncbi:hypothetical protein C3486_14925 [Streptomyces sp. Ru73]|uniref:response regulator transcription factor n=1 Tax=Streptomyces sp. Ru73 TaxID=2080748 RepID=UPI000CDCE844|nr:helix-turn-helix transcriptional regulator [Streptomyces sp. Ru73]POX40231.1 hypothetical protein C3486_14925 [Streptomyces sp. Ru73]